MPVELINHAASHASGSADPITPASIVAIPDAAKILQMTWTGEWQYVYPIELCSQWVNPSGVGSGVIDSIAATNGVGIYQFVFAEANVTGSSILSSPVLTSLAFDNLVFVGSAFSPLALNALTSLSLPLLTTVGTTFSPNAMALLTTLSIPALTTIGTSFNPNTMAALTTLSAPLLATVGTSFTPSTMGSLITLSAPSLTFIGATFLPRPRCRH